MNYRTPNDEIDLDSAPSEPAPSLPDEVAKLQEVVRLHQSMLHMITLEIERLRAAEQPSGPVEQQVVPQVREALGRKLLSVELPDNYGAVLIHVGDDGHGRLEYRSGEHREALPLTLKKRGARK